MADFAHLQLCLSGDFSLPAAGCENADLTGDLHVNSSDVTPFRACLSGPAVVPDNNCGQ